MMEYEKKLRAGDDFVQSIRNVIDSQVDCFSPWFTTKRLPGIVRSFQEKPFKLLMGNFDQLRIGAEYLNKVDLNFICIDSSGKLWGERQKKNEPKKLNTALVIPPLEKGGTPFAIFEQISESNKTIDFIVFLKYAWHYMREAVNNQNVKFPIMIIREGFNQQ